jgi:hypothetical protein
MRICSNAVQLRNALKKIKPSKIAVAFVGDGWKRYVSPTNLKEIVLSPTLGSNPKAIEEIMDLIEPSNVYFLDNLHSKIYLGTESALIGSSNLSDNGFADSQHLEAGVVLSDSTSLEKLRSVFDAYKTSATSLYPTTERKKEKLRELVILWQSSIWHGLNPERGSGKSPVIAEYRSELDRIHIAWYRPVEVDYNEEKIGAVVPDANGLDPDDYFSETLFFLEEDSVEQGDWILCWYPRDDGYPRSNGNVRWIHVHHVVPNGVNHDTYSKLIGQAKNLFCPPPPFTLDSHTKSLIRDALTSDEFPQLLALDIALDDEASQLAPADAVVPRFLEYLRKAQQSAPVDSGDSSR